MTYHFEELDRGDLMIMTVSWEDSLESETVEMRFLDYDADLHGSEIKIRSVDGGTRYRVPNTCGDRTVSIYTEQNCFNCGQLHWGSCGEVHDVDVPNVPEVEQQTFEDISSQLTGEGGDGYDRRG